jgi:hypothetical protein
VTKVILIALLGCTVMAAGFASAQTPGESESLKAQVDALQKQVDALQAQLDALKAQLEAQRNAAPTALPATQAAAPADAARVGESIQQRDVLNKNPDAVARIDNAPLDPTQQGFIPIPGTHTRLKFGGHAKVDVIRDFRPAGDPDAFTTSMIPVGDVPSADNTSMSARPSKLSMDFRSPAPKGDLRVFYENDFYGATAGTMQFHLKHLYGQRWNVLVGYTYSTINDIDSMPDTLDAEGPPGLVFVRQPVLRYTFGLGAGKRRTLAIAMEKGTSDIVSAAPDEPITVTATAPKPDLHLRFRQEYHSGHVQLGAVLRSVGGYSSTLVEAHVLGWGASLSGSKRLGSDYLLFQGSYGEGFGRYIQDLAGLGADVGVDSDGRVVAIPVGGWAVAYQHYWRERLRSSATYGSAWADSAGKTHTTTFERSDYAGANIIWSPADTMFNVGLEYLWGRHELNTGEWGWANRLVMSVQYDIVR